MVGGGWLVVVVVVHDTVVVVVHDTVKNRICSSKRDSIYDAIYDRIDENMHC